VLSRKSWQRARLFSLLAQSDQSERAFAITGSTGVFAGVSGGGPFIDYFAGDVRVVNLKGTIS
jgi:hypothetical protein